jgi:hypothetical protein
MATYKSIKYIIPTEAVEHTDSINALADVDTTTVAPSVGQTLKWSAANSRWQPADIEEAAASSTQKALFGFGNGILSDYTYQTLNLINLVSSTGVVATDTTGAGTARKGLAGSGYGGDKAIFGFGETDSGKNNVTNLVSNTGVVSTDQTGVGTARTKLSAAGFGGDKAIFGFGDIGSSSANATNLVSNAGVVSTDQTGVGTARFSLAAASYGEDKALFGFGYGLVGGNNESINVTNLVSNTGVVSSDTTGVGSARDGLAAASYGSTGQAIFGYGLTSNPATYSSITNLVSNTGVVATDTTGVGTGRYKLAATNYGGDKAIFGFGAKQSEYGGDEGVSITNLVSNTGVVASDTTGVGTARYSLAGAGYSSTA